MHHKPCNLSQLVCLDVNLLQIDIFYLLERNNPLSVCTFLTFLVKNNVRASTSTPFFFIVQDFFSQPFVCIIQPCLVCSLKFKVRRLFIPPMGSPRVPGIIGLPKQACITSQVICLSWFAQMLIYSNETISCCWKKYSNVCLYFLNFSSEKYCQSKQNHSICFFYCARFFQSAICLYHLALSCMQS